MLNHLVGIPRLASLLGGSPSLLAGLPDISVGIHATQDQVMVTEQADLGLRSTGSAFTIGWNFPRTSSLFHVLKTRFLFLFPPLMPAPPGVFPDAINGTSICLVAQAKGREPTLPPLLLSLIREFWCLALRTHPESAPHRVCSRDRALLALTWTTANASEHLSSLPLCPLTSTLHTPDGVAF